MMWMEATVAKYFMPWTVSSCQNGYYFECHSPVADCSAKNVWLLWMIQRL
jgi:hypothetical protein